MPFDRDRILMMANLVADHEEMEDQPLVPAIYYGSKLYPNDYCLFEVAQHFGYDEVAPDGYMTQVSYGSTPGFPLPTGADLVLLLTNPNECRRAIEAGWKQVRDVQEAMVSRDFEVLYSDNANVLATELLSLLTQPMVLA